MREVTAAIIRRNGKILICRRAEGSCAHLWEFPGGKTEPGETPFECLTRELREELNIEIKPLREYCRSVCGELSFVFIEAEIISGEPQLSQFTRKCGGYCRMSFTAFEWCPADRPVAEEISKSTEHTNNPLR